MPPDRPMVVAVLKDRNCCPLFFPVSKVSEGVSAYPISRSLFSYNAGLIARSFSRGGRTMRIAIVGSGYVGLVSGACLADFGHQVVCIDKAEAKIADLQGGRMPI